MSTEKMVRVTLDDEEWRALRIFAGNVDKSIAATVSHILSARLMGYLDAFPEESENR